MFWAGERILNEFISRGVVAPFHFSPDRIDCNSYRLRVGNEFFVTSDHSRKQLPLTGIQLFSSRFGEPIGSCTIPTGQFAFLMTEESISIPKDAMGFVSLRTNEVKFRGLVNISGFHVDPGYSGKLIFAVFNAGPSPITVRYLDPIFLLWLADIDTGTSQKETSYHYTKVGRTDLPATMVSHVSDRLVSLQDISKRIEEIDKKIFMITTIGFAVAVAIAFASNLDKFVNG